MDINSENIITLQGEKGEQIKLELLDAFRLDEETYVVLLPLDENASEVIILQIEDLGEEDEVSYLSVEDPELLQKVFAIFMDRNKDRYNFN
ncbi:MAG: DUF1292 domain-containing protein [Allobaculum sp.]|nr:DUF1292 domain-containing protein [Allobaculum sp.]